MRDHLPRTTSEQRIMVPESLIHGHSGIRPSKSPSNNSSDSSNESASKVPGPRCFGGGGGGTIYRSFRPYIPLHLSPSFNVALCDDMVTVDTNGLRKQGKTSKNLPDAEDEATPNAVPNWAQCPIVLARVYVNKDEKATYYNLFHRLSPFFEKAAGKKVRWKHLDKTGITAIVTDMCMKQSSALGKYLTSPDAIMNEERTLNRMLPVGGTERQAER
ncbi:hypothetical protein CNMCM5878_007562 [Aspergillus fumigatiaffinis]|nr:hypothetical protein CNMCM5878_007562 [Aspergillus fumigatiaffinis]